MGIAGKYDIECRFMDVLFTWGNKKGSIYLFASLWFHLLHPQPLNCHSSFAVSHKQTEHTSGSSSALPVCQQILWWGKRLFSFLSHPKEAIPLYALLPAIFFFFFFIPFNSDTPEKRKCEILIESISLGCEMENCSGNWFLRVHCALPLEVTENG